MAPKKTDGMLDDEPLSPPDDDTALPEPTPTPRSTRKDDADDEPLPAPQLRGDPKRDEIARRYRENQIKEREGGSDEGVPDGDESFDEGDAQEAKSTPAAPRQDYQAPQEDPELELLVYGQRIRKKRSDLVKDYDLEGLDDAHIIRTAQKEMAADQRLAAAKEAEHQRPGNQSPQSAAQGEGSAADQRVDFQSPDADGLDATGSPRGTDQAVDEEKLAEIANRIQVGDAEEGKQALAELMQLAKGQNAPLTQEQLQAAVSSVLTQRTHQNEVYEALQKFRDDNPDLMEKRHMWTVALDMTGEEMIADMRKIGITDEQLSPIAGDRKAIATAHRRLREKGFDVRDVATVLKDTGARIRGEFNMPAPSTVPAPTPRSQSASPSQAQVRERVTRKELHQPQPRHGGSPRGTAQQAQRPRSAQEIIQEQRKQRGFRT